jgi:AcrR family transcriptional regulator
MCTTIHIMCMVVHMIYAEGVTEPAARPRNAQATRQMILDRARPLFAQHGYAATTVKAVAMAAAVSPNLITRYFGGKEGLFLASTRTELQLDPVFSGPRESLGANLAASIVRRWSGMDGEDPLLVLQRAAGERPESAEALASFLDVQSLQPLVRCLLAYGFTQSEARSRAAAIDAIVLGVSTRHRVLRNDLDDLDALRSWLATTIQRLVDAA